MDLVKVRTRIVSSIYDVPEFRPFWAVVEELEVPFYLHPRNPLTDQMLFFDRAPLVH